MDFETAKNIIISHLNCSNDLPEDIKPLIVDIIKKCRCNEVNSFNLDEFLVFHRPESKQNIKFPSPEKCECSCRFCGKNIVFTGFSTEEKESLKPVADVLKIHINSGVCKSTEFLVCGSNAGPAKMSKAKEFGIEMLSAEKFIDEITKK